MTFELPPLPYAQNALEPFISKETISFHYEKHHATYLKNLNDLLKEDSTGNQKLETVILDSATDPSKQAIFNNAAQAWNHAFYWKSLTPPKQENSPTDSALLNLINRDFRNIENLKDTLKKTALGQFGSGWGWLVLDNGALKVTRTSNADTPLTTTAKPLLCIDVWEHAYYLDYQNKRAEYLENIVEHLLNWDFAAQNLNT